MLKLKKIVVGALETNCYILYDEGKSIVIDPGDDFQLIESFLLSENLTCEFILLTHAHFDHIKAVDSLVEKYGSKVLINESDFHLLTDAALNLSMNFYRKAITVKTKNIKTVKDEQMNLLGYTFNFVTTPGHTPGSMCIIVEDKMFTGDTLFYRSIGNAFPPYGNTTQEIESIKSKLYTLDFDYTCLTGHGLQTKLFYEINNNPYTGDIYSGY